MKNMKNWFILAAVVLTLSACGSASNTSSVTISAQSSTGVLGDGNGTYTVDISVKDGGGQGVANQLITFDVSTVNTGAITNPIGVTTFSVLAKDMRTDGNGKFSVNISHTNTAGETIYVRAVSESGVKSPWQSLIYTSTGQVVNAVTSGNVGAIRINTPDDTKNQLLADGTTSVVANNKVAYTVVIQVEDLNGLPLAGEVVKLTKSGGNGILKFIVDPANINPAGGYFTDAFGIVNLTVTDLSAASETWVLTPQAGTFATPPTLSLSYLGTGNGAAAGGATASNELILATPNNSGVIADGVGSYLVTLQLRDKYTFAPVANQSVSFVPSGAAGLVRITPLNGTVLKTDNQGILEVKVTDIHAKDEVVSLDAKYVDNASSVTINSINALKLNFVGLATAAAGGGTSTGFKVLATRIDVNKAKDKGRLPADNYTAAQIQVVVSDPSVTPAKLQSAQSVTATYASGNVTASQTLTTDALGKAVFNISSPTTGIIDVVFTITGNAGTSTFTGLVFVPAVKYLTISKLLFDAAGKPKQNFLAANGEIATLEVFAKDANLQPVAGEVLSIATDSYSANVLDGISVITDASGRATVSLSDSADETVTVTLQSRQGGLFPGSIQTATTSIKFVPTPQQRVDAVTISPNKFSLLTDNSDTIQLTVVVLDSNKGAVSDVVVDVYTSEGVLATGSRHTTDASGKIVIPLQSGALRKNALATIQAVVNAPNSANAVAGVISTSVQVSMTGSTIALTPTSSILTLAGATTQLALKAVDAANNPIQNTVILLAQTPKAGSTSNLTLSATSVTTDINGLASVDVYAIASNIVGTATVTATGLGGATASQDYTVAAAANAFGITSPTTSPYAWTTNTNLTVTVNNPTATDSVTFVTDCGTWDGGISNYVTKIGLATLTATLSSSVACTAKVQVINLTQGTSSPLTVAISAPSNTAKTLTLQATKGVLQPDKGAGGESTTLTANVRDTYGNAVGKAWVLFTINNPTGGGETMSNIIAQSDSFGRATTTFTAGRQSSGGNGVTLKAEVLGLAISGTTNVVIGGTPGSVVIGRSSVILVHSDTTYKLPMSVMVADTNGNPMSNTTVSLGVWPIEYSTGAYVQNAQGVCAPAITGTFPNEDLDEDTTLDPLASKLNASAAKIATLNAAYPTVVDAAGVLLNANGEDLNNDKQLTPPNSSSGTLPATVTTDAFGVATFDLVYPKSSSYWITNRIRANTLVLGSEATTEIKSRLVGLDTDVKSCFLANSPFSNVNSAAVSVSLSPQSTVTVGNAVALSALVVDSATGSPVALQDVSFSFVSSVTGITLSTATAKSDLAGIAQVWVNDVNGKGGLVSVKAQAGTSSSTANINFLSVTADPYALALSATPSSGVSPDGLTPAVISANVTDVYGVAVANAAVRFEVTAGTASLKTFQAITSASGLATSNLTSATAGGVTVKVSLFNNAGLVDKYASVVVSFGVTPASIALTSSTTTVPTDGVASVTVTVLDSAAQPVVGEKVSISTSSVSAIATPTSVTTDANGQAVVAVTDIYAEAISVQATSNSVATVNRTLGITFTEVVGIVDPYTVVFTNALDSAGAPLNVSKSLDVYTTATAADSYSSYASGLDTVQVQYQVRSASNISLAGLNVSFATTGRAIISPTSATTDANGKVTVTVTDAYAEVITISAITGGKTGSQALTFTSLPSSSIQLTSTSPAPAVIGLSGAGVQQSASLVFTVVDTNNNPVQGNNLVDFSIVNGGLNGGEQLTVKQASTVNGQVTAVVNAGEVSGTIQVRASLNADNTIFTDVPVTISGGLPSGNSFSITAGLKNIAGRLDPGLTQNITAWVSDFFSNPVAPGQQASFQTDFAAVSNANAQFVDVGGSSSANVIVQATAGAPNAPTDGFVTLEGNTIGGSHSKVLSLAAVDKLTFYAGTDGGGVYKTTDGGATWVHPGTALKAIGANKFNNLLGGVVRGLAIDPTNNNAIFAATEKGLFVSTDAGVSWKTLTGLKRIVGENIGTVAGTGVFANKGTAGINGRWSNLGANAAATTFAFSFAHSGVRARTKVYVDGKPTTSYNLTPTGVQLIGSGTKTTDGVTVTAATSVISMDYDSKSIMPQLPTWDVVVDSYTYNAALGYAQTIYVAVYGDGVWKTTNGGNSWSKSSNMAANQSVLFDNRVTTLAINPITGTTAGTNTYAELFVGTDGSGVFRSQDNGATWTHQQGIANSVIQDVLIQPNTAADATNVWVAGKNGIHYTTTAGVALPTWLAATMDTYAGATPDVRALAMDADVPNALYAIVYGDITGNAKPLGGVYSSTDNGVNWAKVAGNVAAATVTGAHRLDALALSGTAGADDLIVGTEGRAVFSSVDSGLTWAAKSGTASTALTNALFTTTTLMHSGGTALQVLPLSTTYQPMNDSTQPTPGYTGTASSIYHGESHTFLIRVADDLGNPLVSGSTLSVAVDVGTVTGDTNVAILDSINGSTDYKVNWVNDTISTDYTLTSTLIGTMTVSVTSANGAASGAISRSLVKPLVVPAQSIDVYSSTLPAMKLVSVSAEGGSNNAAGYIFTAATGCSLNYVTATGGPFTTCALASGVTSVTSTTATASFYFDIPASGKVPHLVSAKDRATGATGTGTITLNYVAP